MVVVRLVVVVVGRVVVVVRRVVVGLGVVFGGKYSCDGVVLRVVVVVVVVGTRWGSSNELSGFG